jgi:hypothetical protein
VIMKEVESGSEKETWESDPFAWLRH